MDFAIDADIVELASTVADFFGRRDDTRAIAIGAATDMAGDAARWTALCNMGLPALRVAEPRGIGARVLDATAVAERVGAVLLPEPASASIVLARAWDEHGGSAETLGGLLNGSRVASFAGFERVTVSSGAAVSGRVRIVDDGVAEYVVAPTASGLVLLDSATCEDRGDRRAVDPTRPTVQSELRNVVAVEALRLTPESLAAVERELAVMMIAELVGGMQVILDATIAYVTERRQFGRSIGSFQTVKHQLADMYVSSEQAQASVQFAAISLDQRSESAAADVATAARWVPRAAIELFDHAIHLHGAMGYSWEVDVHLHLRRALATRRILLAANSVIAPRIDARRLAS